MLKRIEEVAYFIEAWLLIGSVYILYFIDMVFGHFGLVAPVLICTKIIGIMLVEIRRIVYYETGEDMLDEYSESEKASYFNITEGLE